MNEQDYIKTLREFESSLSADIPYLIKTKDLPADLELLWLNWRLDCAIVHITVHFKGGHRLSVVVNFKRNMKKLFERNYFQKLDAAAKIAAASKRGARFTAQDLAKIRILRAVFDAIQYVAASDMPYMYTQQINAIIDDSGAISYEAI